MDTRGFKGLGDVGDLEGAGNPGCPRSWRSLALRSLRSRCINDASLDMLVLDLEDFGRVMAAAWSQLDAASLVHCLALDEPPPCPRRQASHMMFVSSQTPGIPGKLKPAKKSGETEGIEPPRRYPEK